MIIAPFLPNKGPTIRIDMTDPGYDWSGTYTGEPGCRVRISTTLDGEHSAERDPAVWPVGTVVFEGTRYRPSMRASETGQANEILAFVMAYVERPEEFDREPSDMEQEHAAFWRTYGESFQLDTDEED